MGHKVRNFQVMGTKQDISITKLLAATGGYSCFSC